MENKKVIKSVRELKGNSQFSGYDIDIEKVLYAPDSVTIKSKKDLKEKLQKGLDDIKLNKTYSLDEVFHKIDNL